MRKRPRCSCLNVQERHVSGTPQSLTVRTLSFGVLPLSPKENPMAPQDTDSPLDYTKRAADNAQDRAGKVAEHAREYGEKAQEAARQARPFVEKPLREQPLITL